MFQNQENNNKTKENLSSSTDSEEQDRKYINQFLQGLPNDEPYDPFDELVEKLHYDSECKKDESDVSEELKNVLDEIDDFYGNENNENNDNSDEVSIAIKNDQNSDQNQNVGECTLSEIEIKFIVNKEVEKIGLVHKNYEGLKFLENRFKKKHQKFLKKCQKKYDKNQEFQRTEDKVMVRFYELLLERIYKQRRALQEQEVINKSVRQELGIEPKTTINNNQCIYNNKELEIYNNNQRQFYNFPQEFYNISQGLDDI